MANDGVRGVGISYSKGAQKESCLYREDSQNAAQKGDEVDDYSRSRAGSA